MWDGDIINISGKYMVNMVRYSLLSDLLYYLLWYNMIGLSLIVRTLVTAQTARTLQNAINFVFDRSTKIMHCPENQMHTIIGQYY